MHGNARSMFSGLAILVVILCTAVPSAHAQSTDARASHSVPNLLKFNGTAKDAEGQPLKGMVGITFTFYRDEQNGAALWMETQNVQADEAGRYNVSLGAIQAAPSRTFQVGGCALARSASRRAGRKKSSVAGQRSVRHKSWRR